MVVAHHTADAAEGVEIWGIHNLRFLNTGGMHVVLVPAMLFSSSFLCELQETSQESVVQQEQVMESQYCISR